MFKTVKHTSESQTDKVAHTVIPSFLKVHQLYRCKKIQNLFCRTSLALVNEQL